jgi:hypothetical protein
MSAQQGGPSSEYIVAHKQSIELLLSRALNAAFKQRSDDPVAHIAHWLLEQRGAPAPAPASSDGVLRAEVERLRLENTRLRSEVGQLRAAGYRQPSAPSGLSSDLWLSSRIISPLGTQQ